MIILFIFDFLLSFIFLGVEELSRNHMRVDEMVIHVSSQTIKFMHTFNISNSMDLCTWYMVCLKTFIFIVTTTKNNSRRLNKNLVVVQNLASRFLEFCLKAIRYSLCKKNLYSMTRFKIGLQILFCLSGSVKEYNIKLYSLIVLTRQR